jgi:hypothetical protein
VCTKDKAEEISRHYQTGGGKRELLYIGTQPDKGALETNAEEQYGRAQEQ